MKKYLLILFLSLCFVNGNAQAWIYHPMPESNAVWRVDDQNAFPCFIPGLYSSYQYTLVGDTIIGIYTYKKIFISGLTDICFGTPTGFNFLRGALRNDTVNKKVYFRPLVSNALRDTLLYDFSLQVGDTLYGTYNSDPYPNSNFTIDIIDSVLVGNAYHRRFSHAGGSFSYIEGVGSATGLLEPLTMPIDDIIQLMCFSHNSEFYPSSISSCPLIDYTIGISEINSSNDILTISPNPFSSQTTITFSEAQKNTTIRITDMLGQEIKTINFTGKLLTLDKGEMNAGIYFVQTTDEKNNVSNKKIIIQ